jgi:branched-chain amino acid aminotransferase
LVPIKSITCRSKNETFTYEAAAKEPGPVCVKLLTTLKAVQQGKLEDKWGWLDQVPEPPSHSLKNGINGS